MDRIACEDCSNRYNKGIRRRSSSWTGWPVKTAIAMNKLEYEYSDSAKCKESNSKPKQFSTKVD